MAALVQYSLSGPPIVFAGTETGLSQDRPMFQNGRNIFEECRLPMNWDTVDSRLQGYYQKLNRTKTKPSCDLARKKKCNAPGFDGRHLRLSSVN